MRCPALTIPLVGRHPGLAGAAAGSVEALVNCPFETVKVQMQAKENLQRFKVGAVDFGLLGCFHHPPSLPPSHSQNTADCLRYIVREEGLVSLYRGLEAQTWRNAAWNGTYFACIGTMKNWFPTRPGDSHCERGCRRWRRDGAERLFVCSNFSSAILPQYQGSSWGKNSWRGWAAACWAC